MNQIIDQNNWHSIGRGVEVAQETEKAYLIQFSDGTFSGGRTQKWIPKSAVQIVDQEWFVAKWFYYAKRVYNW